MATTKIVRKLQKIFGSTAAADEIAQYGSLAAASPTYSTDPETIQALANYLQGWYGAIVGGANPAIEDMNALCYLYAYQLAYILQAGVPEWKDDDVYFTNNFVAGAATGQLYVSTSNDNGTNPATDYSNWRRCTLGPQPEVNSIGVSPLTLDATTFEKQILVDTTQGIFTINLPAAANNYIFSCGDIGGMAAINPITLVPNGVETIQGLNTNYLCNSPFGRWSFVSTGAAWYSI